MDKEKTITTIKNVLIILGCVLAVIITVAANVVAYTQGVGWLGWLIGDIIVVFVDVMFAIGIKKRFFSKKEV